MQFGLSSSYVMPDMKEEEGKENTREFKKDFANGESIKKKLGARPY